MRRTFLMMMSLVAYACGGGNSTETFNSTMSQANEPAANHLRPSNATGTAYSRQRADRRASSCCTASAPTS